MKQIYFAGGCFWGAEKYLSLIPGVAYTEVGYANGKTKNPSYEAVCRENTGHAETVRVEYDPNEVSLPFLLELFYDAIDPTTVNRQGGDVGVQYRTGIYYTDEDDRPVVDASIRNLQQRLSKPVAIEVMPLVNYYPAEEYHQKYLDKNPGGYCHIGADQFQKAKHSVDGNRKYQLKTKDELRSSLTDIQFNVTQNASIEPPFRNEYWDTFEPGIYVDVTTGEPLFTSSEKFESGCGWPSFSKPLSPSLLKEMYDSSHGMERIEIRSSLSDAHLGHVFPDGPKEHGGLRYCINSAALRFVPKRDMEKEGYGHLLGLIE